MVHYIFRYRESPNLRQLGAELGQPGVNVKKRKESSISSIAVSVATFVSRYIGSTVRPPKSCGRNYFMPVLPFPAVSSHISVTRIYLYHHVLPRLHTCENYFAKRRRNNEIEKRKRTPRLPIRKGTRSKEYNVNETKEVKT